MSYFPTTRHPQHRDVPSAAEDEHEPLSFSAMCRAVGHGNRLLRLQRGMLKHSIRLAEPDRKEAEDDA